VQVQYVREVTARPLRLLLVTWNMGNAPPDETFPQCFEQAAECASAPTPAANSLIACA
jgi:hypothetical protein